MDDQELKHQSERLRALWKSGRDKYASFFSVLNEVRAEIGDEALGNWCFDELRIGLSVIMDIRRLLTATDADIVKADLAAARKAEKDQKDRESAARRKAKDIEDQQREAERQAREIRKAEHAKKLAELKDATKKVDEREKTRARRAADPKMSGEHANAGAAKRRAINKIDNADFIAAAEAYKKCDAMCKDGDERWVQGSVGKAKALLRMRDTNLSHQDFGAAIASAGIEINPHDRAALINLAALPKLDELFRSSESRSYRLIWQKLSQLRAVGE